MAEHTAHFELDDSASGPALPTEHHPGWTPPPGWLVNTENSTVFGAGPGMRDGYLKVLYEYPNSNYSAPNLPLETQRSESIYGPLEATSDIDWRHKHHLSDSFSSRPSVEATALSKCSTLADKIFDIDSDSLSSFSAPQNTPNQQTTTVLDRASYPNLVVDGIRNLDNLEQSGHFHVVWQFYEPSGSDGSSVWFCKNNSATGKVIPTSLRCMKTDDTINGIRGTCSTGACLIKHDNMNTNAFVNDIALYMMSCSVPGCTYTQPSLRFGLMVEHIAHHLREPEATAFSSSMVALRALAPRTGKLKASISTPSLRSNAGPDGNSNLCTVKGCDRAIIGNGFSRSDNLLNHLRQVHGQTILRKRQRKVARPKTPVPP